jgi:hypothetical protein
MADFRNFRRDIQPIYSGGRVVGHVPGPVEYVDREYVGRQYDMRGEALTSQHIEEAVRHATADYIGVVNTEENRHLAATNVQDALNAIATGIQWNDNMLRTDEFGNMVVTVDGNVLTQGNDYYETITSNNISIGSTHATNAEVEDLKDQIQALKDEINELKMSLLEN